MEYGEFPPSVVNDYRMNIFVDWDSPIIAAKAVRDRFPASHRFAGLPCMGSLHSEDAVTWAVFRGFQKAERLSILADRFSIGEPRGLLIWGLAPEQGRQDGMLQFVAGDLLRKIDGLSPRQASEPDVVLLGSTGVAVGVAAKLSEEYKAKHLWAGNLRQARRLRRLLRVYEEAHPFGCPAKVSEDTAGVAEGAGVGAGGEAAEQPAADGDGADEAAAADRGILKDGATDEEAASVYHLVRMALFAKQLGAHFQVEPVLVSLASTRQWDDPATESGESAADVWNRFVGLLGANSPRCDLLYWQHLSRLDGSTAIGGLMTYLYRRPLLYDVAEEKMPGW